VHADAIARALKMQGYICPASAGVASALGFLTAPASFEFARTHIARVVPGAMAEIETVFAALEQEGRATLAEAGVPEQEMRFVRQADLRHVGQGHEIVVELPGDALDGGPEVVEALRERFFADYERIYGHAHRHLDLEITTCRLTASGPKPTVTLEELRSGGSPEAAVKGTRRAFFAEAGGFVETPLYDRSKLAPGASFEGPAIVEEVDSTAVIGPGTTVTVDAYADLVVTFDGSEA
jgi:N-methylhydantoinase A